VKKLLLVFLALSACLGADVVVLQVSGEIQPSSANYIVNGIRNAQEAGAALIVIELNTPGGLMTSMRDIISAMLNSPVPVAVYVSPSGSQAASAGFFILMGGDLAVMAPGTNSGAAHPVGGQGEDIPKTMGKKVEEDARAYMRTLAEKHGRNIELAEKAVKESVSFTETEALDHGLIDFTASSVEDLLAKADGRKVVKKDKPITLAVKGTVVKVVRMGAAQRLLGIIAQPFIAYLLLGLGFLGIYVEITHPGTIAPGIIGALCLLLAFYGLSILPVNYAGLALILLGVILFILEIKITSYGALTAGGLAAFIIGSLMLIDSPEPSLRISMALIFTVAIIVAAVVLFLTHRVVVAHRTKVVTGVEGLVGEGGTAILDVHDSGKVFLHGEYWEAYSDLPIPAGSRIRVLAVEGMRLKVTQT
jgi:membrane-bound serine protease (ClpP class)